MTALTAPVVLRPATGEDVPGLVALERELFGDDAWSRAAVAECLDGSGRATVVAEADDGVVGYAVVRLTGDVADLERIAVVAARRRSGLATGLLEAVAAHARRGGAERLLLEVSADNPGARAFYAARGFTDLHRRPRYYRDGSDAVVLQRPVAVEVTAEGEGSRG